MSRQPVLQSRSRIGLSLAAMSVMGAVALAAAPPTAPPTVAKETREKMAVLHEQMAACLRSDTSLADCHVEMRKNCKESLGDQGCPMMGMGTGMGKYSHQSK